MDGEGARPVAAVDSRDAGLALLREEARNLRIETVILRKLRTAAEGAVPSRRQILVTAFD